MTIFLVRHGHAGDRKKWTGPDDARPLSEKGRGEATGLVEVVDSAPVTRILSSPAGRCVQTAQPLADALGMKVQTTDILAEGADTDEALELLRSLAGTTPVVCTHGDVIEKVLDALARADGMPLPWPYPCAKGSTWVLEPDAQGRFVAARYLPPPA